MTSTSIAAEESINIEVKTEIGNLGRLVSEIEYTLNDSEIEYQDVSPASFDIKIGESTYEVKSVEIQDNQINLLTERFPLNGTITQVGEEYVAEPFEVQSDIPELSFNLEDIQEVETKTADDFTKNEFISDDGTKLNYWLYTPDQDQPAPLMVWLHGGGESLADSYEGSNIYANRGAVAWAEFNPESAVLSVQFPENYPFGISEKKEMELMEAYNTAQYELITTLIEDGMIDSQRVYLSGASSGGGAVLRFLMQYPDLFAAAVPICAKDTIVPLSEQYELAYADFDKLELSPSDYNLVYESFENILSEIDITDVPIWFVHSDSDPICTSYTTKITYEILENQGAHQNKLTLYDDDFIETKNSTGLGANFDYHSAWIPALENTEILEWVYSQQK